MPHQRHGKTSSLTQNQASNDATQDGAQSPCRLLEVFSLCEARKALNIRREDGGISVRACDRWLWVMEMCKARGVSHSKDQCKSKYKRLHELYVRIRDYERRIPSSCNIYWQMNNAKRRQKGFPTEEFPMVLYKKMKVLFRDKRNVDVGSLLSDSFDDDNLLTGVDPLDANDPRTPSNQHMGEQSRCMGVTKATLADGESNGLKRKRCERARTMKDVVESTRKLMSHMEASKDRKDSKNEKNYMVLLDIEARRSQAQLETEAVRTTIVREGGQALCNTIAYLGDYIKTLATPRGNHNGSQ
ncbi:hypothetical protein L7F22_035211 [Adiantum nelumboides]|nr:hypothetical protein [Adiantum nelumboides]